MIATGLSGIEIFVRQDEVPAFEALMLDLASNLNPANAHEYHLFDVALAAAWSLRRCLAAEAALHNEADALGLVDIFFDEDFGKKLDKINRYKRQHESSYRRAVAELKKLAAARAESQDIPRVELPAPRREPIPLRSQDPTEPLVEPEASPLSPRAA